jgi:PilZ domain-containing protein
MSNAAPHAGPVTLDLYSLEVWGLQGAGYSVRLAGEIDDTWVDAIALAQHVQGGDPRFYVDRKKAALVFAVETGKDLQATLSDAQALVDTVNERTGRRMMKRPAVVPAADAPAEGARKSKQQRMEETRDSKRVGASWMVQFRPRGGGADSATTGMTRDVSESGLFIVTNKLPAVGEKLTLTVHVESRDRVDMTGEVVRVLDRNEAFQRQEKAGFGARVSDPSGRYSSRITRGGGSS